MPIKIIIYTVAFLAAMSALGLLYANGYSSGYAARDVAYQKATQELNTRIASLQTELATARQAQQEENQKATAELIASIKDEKCAELTKDEIARLNRIR